MRLAGMVAVVLWLCGSAVAGGEPQVRLPRDHLGHAGASIEWWYFTAFVRDRAGRRYSVFFTLFASRGVLVPVAEVRNLDSGAVVGHSERLAPGRVGGSALDVRVAGSRLRYLPGSNTWLFSVSGPGLQVSLRQRPEKAYVLNGGGTGEIEQSIAGRSHYYSATRMRASGTVRVGGKTVAINGESWFDHQWGNYANDPRAFNWEWFSCRFDDRTELMLYQFLDRKTHRPLARYRNGTYVNTNGTAIPITTFEAHHTRQALTAAGHTWPLDWQLHVPAPNLTESLRSLLRDQLVRNTIVPTFWEGAAQATGTHTGTCFVEISYR
jgi:predicted secreted hydrolase